MIDGWTAKKIQIGGWTKGNDIVHEEDPRPKTYQKPKEGHPWRQYDKTQNRPEPKTREDIIPLKDCLVQIVENWDRVEVTYMSSMGDRTYTLSQLPQKKAAAYLCGLLKRNYVQHIKD